VYGCFEDLPIGGSPRPFATPRILKELDLSHVLDWCADDQPFVLNVPGMISVPYSVEVNDIGLFVAKGLSGEDFYRAVADSFLTKYLAKALSRESASHC
jgi:allantoinase